MFQIFLLAFVPLFVALDSFGTFPIFLSITERDTPHEQRKLAGQSTLTAFLVGAGFLFAGHAIMKFLGITLNDFRVAGGVILLCFAVYDLLFSHLQRSLSEGMGPKEMADTTIRVKSNSASFAIVPLGIPLIVGPAALTAILLLGGEYGPYMTLAAFAVNILLIYLLFANAVLFTRYVPQPVMRAASKIVALFLAAIAVMMLRTGLAGMIVR